MCCFDKWSRAGIILQGPLGHPGQCIPGKEEAKKPKSCDLNELILPENALGWICSENSFYSNDLILKSGKCSIDCQDGYIATSGKIFF